VAEDYNMTVLTQTYGAAIAIPITYASLANGGYRMSDIVDNAGANNYIDAIVNALVRVGTLGATGYLALYAYGTADGAEYTAGLNNAADATITWGTTGRSGLLSYQALPVLGTVPTDATDDDDYVTMGPYSIRDIFGGVMPRKWGIVLLNQTGATLQATQTDSFLKYSGIKYDST
jgi:hypothetical protein